MKVSLFSLFMAASTIVFTACGNENNAPAAGTTTAENSNASTVDGQASPGASSGSTTVAATPVQDVVEHYLHIKNALANDNGAEAANGAQAMVASLEKINPATFTDEQQKLYNDVAEDLKEHAEHTADNAGKIDHQREHFVMMSANVQELIQTFGAHKTLYLDHCPMANNDKGANWISETEEISNPYMGKKMPKCGSMEKVIKP